MWGFSHQRGNISICRMVVNSSPIPTHPHTNSTSTAVKASPTHPLQASIPDQLIPSHRPSVTNTSLTHDHIIGYPICFKVRPTDSDYFGSVIKTYLLLETIFYYLKKYYTCRHINIQLKIPSRMIIKQEIYILYLKHMSLKKILRPITCRHINIQLKIAGHMILKHDIYINIHNK